MHEPTSHQRLATFVAQHSRSIFPIANSFVERLAGSFPGARGMFHLNSKTERYEFACVVSELCKNIGNLRACEGSIERMGDRLTELGFTEAHVRGARAAFVAAVREHTDSEWNDQIAQDWADVVDRFFACVTLAKGAAAAEPMRMAA